MSLSYTISSVIWLPWWSKAVNLHSNQVCNCPLLQHNIRIYNKTRLSERPHFQSTCEPWFLERFGSQHSRQVGKYVDRRNGRVPREQFMGSVTWARSYLRMRNCQTSSTPTSQGCPLIQSVLSTLSLLKFASNWHTFPWDR